MIPQTKDKSLDDLAADLTEQQRVLVDNIVLHGMTPKQAGIEAGYAEGSVSVSVSRCLAKPHVRAYSQELAMTRLGTAGIEAMGVVVQLMRDARSDYVKLEAAKDMLNRAGWTPPEKKEVRVSGAVNVNISLDHE